MSVNPNDLIITSLETIDAFSLQDEYLWTLDELSQAQIQNTEDTEDVTGKNGRLLKTLKRNKSVTISGTNGVISGGMMATQVGSKFAGGSKTVRVTEFITVSASNFTSNVLTLPNAGVYAVRQALENGSTNDFTKANTVTATGQYQATTSNITFYAGDVSNGNVLIVTYDKTVTGSSVDNIADNEHYADTVKLYINAFAEDKCGKVYRIQFYVPKADFSGSFDIELGGSQVTHAFEAKSLAGGCGVLTNKGLLWTYTVFGTDEETTPALSSIIVATMSTKTSYTAGEAFDSSGMIVAAIRSDGTVDEIHGYTYTPTAALTTSDTAVTISYTENGTTKTTTQAITVTSG